MDPVTDRNTTSRVKVGEFIKFFLFYSIFLFILTDSFLLGTIPVIPGDMMMTSPSRDKVS